MLGTAFATLAARFFDSIEIIEAHQRRQGRLPVGNRRAHRRAAWPRHAAVLGPVAAPHTDQRARGQQVDGIPIHSLRLPGVLARQEVIFGGDGRDPHHRHDTLSASSYERGHPARPAPPPGTRGVTVGLDELLDLGLPDAASRPVAPPGDARRPWSDDRVGERPALHEGPHRASS